MTETKDAELSFYCKAYRLAELKRFQGFAAELLVDGTAGDLADDDIVFIHPNFCVTHSVFLPRRIAYVPSAEWVEFCRRELHFDVPVDIAEALSVA